MKTKKYKKMDEILGGIWRRHTRYVHMREARPGHGRSGTGAGQIGLCRWKTSSDLLARRSESPAQMFLIPSLVSSHSSCVLELSFGIDFLGIGADMIR